MRARELMAEHPHLSLRQVAKAVGISPETARAVRTELRGGSSPCRPAAVSGRSGGADLLTWLRNDLAASNATCTAAIFHHPRFTSKRSTPDGAFAAIWSALYNAGADLVINGHYHSYERFAPQNAAGQADASFGIREIVVGTGGTDLVTFTSSRMANSQVTNDNTHGVLKVTMHASSYDFEFVPVAGKTFTDSGVGTCHGAPGSAQAAAAAKATAIQIQQSLATTDMRRRPH